MTTPGDATTARPTDPASEPATPPSAGRPAPASPEPSDLDGLVEALVELRDTVRDTRFALRLPSAERAEGIRSAMVAQLDDYLLPRLARLDAPLLVVVGGSTGAGKSTLVNSVVRAPVSPAGVLRPTTRAPVLVCHPADLPWFGQANLLPGMLRSTSPSADHGVLQVVSAPALSPGLALLDAPDIDSVVDANRALATQLLAAADLWLFVTTAARYADAVPWELLRTARDRGTAVALVLDRVPGRAGGEIRPHLQEMLSTHGLGEVPLFTLPEVRLDAQGLLPEQVTGRLFEWLTSLGRSASARAAVVRQTVVGAIDALAPAMADLASAASDQLSAASALDAAVRAAYRAAHEGVERGIQDGALLRGEVLARWQELVGTGEIMRALQARIGRVRDRIVAALTGRPAPGERFQEAISTGLVTLLRAAAVDAAEQTVAAWRAHPAGAALLDGSHAGPGPDLEDRIARLVRDWQRAVLELVRTEAGDKRAFARASAYAVNATGLLVMVAVFTATAFIPTGAEIAVAGGTTVAAQKVLEAIFGDQAIRALAGRARTDLLERVQSLLDEEAQRYRAAIEGAGVDGDAPARLRTVSTAVTDRRATVDFGQTG